MIRFKLFQLGVEVVVHVLPLFDHPGGQFGGDLDPLPVSVAKSAAQYVFAFPGMVGPGRIQVVDSLIDGIKDLAKLNKSYRPKVVTFNPTVKLHGSTRLILQPEKSIDFVPIGVCVRETSLLIQPCPKTN